MADEIKVVEPKTRNERIEELLAGSAQDAVGSIKGPSLADQVIPEPKVEDVQDVEDDESNDKKVRIPRSRLKTLTSELKELREQVASVQSSSERIAALEAQLNASKTQDDLPDWWKEAYGDNDISKKGYANQQRIMREEMSRALQEREAQRQAEESARAERVQSIEQSFDEQMDDLEDTIGRTLTDNQKSEILDIVGEYSPMDGDSYVAYLPVSKAYELWSKGQTVDNGKQEIARIAGTSSSGSGGQTSTSTERPQWGDWRKRFGA